MVTFVFSKYLASLVRSNSHLCRRCNCTASAFSDLEHILGNSKTSKNNQATISKSPSALLNSVQDASSYDVSLPDICITPSSVKQVSKCVKYCYENDIPIVPVGARTGLEGGTHAERGGVAFDMTQMKSILKLNPQDLDCHVQAGLTWRDLNDQIKSYGLWFPVDPGASASLGGMSSTSASGTNAVKYGTMRENVLSLDVVVAGGKTISTAGKSTRTKKSSAGLNLTNLFVGSEGTLGIITSVKLRLHPLPSCIAVATVTFPSVLKAVDSVVQTIQCGIPIARIEFLDQHGVDACYRANKLPNLDPERPMLFIELHGLNNEEIEHQIEIMRDIFNSNESKKFYWSSKLEERTELWKARHNLHWAIRQTKPDCTSIGTDVCVPISKFPEMVLITHKLIEKFGLSAPLMGHAGDGNFHSVILYDPKSPEQTKQAKLLAHEMGRAALTLDGTVSGEHGVGRGKIDLLDEQFDDETLNVMYRIKKTLDPKNLFNPGKMFRSDRLASIE